MVAAASGRDHSLVYIILHNDIVQVCITPKRITVYVTSLDRQCDRPADRQQCTLYLGLDFGCLFLIPL